MCHFRVTSWWTEKASGIWFEWTQIKVQALTVGGNVLVFSAGPWVSGSTWKGSYGSTGDGLSNCKLQLHLLSLAEKRKKKIICNLMRPSREIVPSYRQFTKLSEFLESKNLTECSLATLIDALVLLQSRILHSADCNLTGSLQMQQKENLIWRDVWQQFKKVIF